MKVEVTCCEGKDEFGQCLRDRCPNYAKAQERVMSDWPYVGTGFGNLYGEPTHQHFLSGVREDIAELTNAQ
jgi:hypothetical protein